MDQVAEGSARGAAQQHATFASSSFLLTIVTLCGVATLGIQMASWRLLAPAFGTAQPIWAAVIGLTMVFLALGYRLGGALVDRRPEARRLYQLVALAGVATALVPLLAQPMLTVVRVATTLLPQASFVGALVAMGILFVVPLTLLATVNPFVLRLLLVEGGTGSAAAGRTAGAVSALSTVGAIAGTFLTVLLIMPQIGTARTIYLIAMFLILLAVVGLRDWRYALLLLLVGALAWGTAP